MYREDLFRKKMLGQLNEKEEEALATLFATQAEAEEEYQDFRLVMTSVLEGEREELKEFLGSLEEPMVRKIPIQWYAIAASIVLILCLSIFIFRPSNPSALYESYLDPYPNTYLPITREQNGQDSLLYQAFLRYEAGQYETALQSFQSYVNKDSSQAEIYFYMALSHIELGQRKEAETILDSLHGQAIEGYQREIAWYRSMVKLVSGERDQATEGLRELKAMPGSYKKEEVDQLLKKLGG